MGPSLHPAASKSSNTGAIIAAVIAGVLGLVVVMGIIGAFAFRSYVAKARSLAPPVATAAPPTPAGVGSAWLTSTDGVAQIRVPPSWGVQTDINPEAILQAGDLVREEYLLVISDAKMDLAPHVDLDKYAELVVSNMRGRAAVSNLVVQETAAVTLGTQKALRYDITATVDSVNIGYEYLLVEGADRYYQVMTWTLLSQFEDKKPIFRDVTATFRAP